MDLDDFVPSGGGSLRRYPVIHNGQAVATFSTPPLNRDETWQSALRGSEPARPDDQEQAMRQETRPGRPRANPGDEFDLHATSRMIRSALRPGG